MAYIAESQPVQTLKQKCTTFSCVELSIEKSKVEKNKMLHLWCLLQKLLNFAITTETRHSFESVYLPLLHTIFIIT